MTLGIVMKQHFPLVFSIILLQMRELFEEVGILLANTKDGFRFITKGKRNEISK
ncbi:putative membrane protein YhfC [Neobacillus niacini]|uniref:hypothetical protein n=1 Tax=Neobacillus niacini TaxID=86668 RepID=UPI002780FA64|nr:hypothetical protein [Neobacillus niacini]MDQ1002258.1 putative membrane protein YhfC [Neobacillus niacini]